MTSNNEYFGDTIDCLIFARLYSIMVVLYHCQVNANATTTHAFNGSGDGSILIWYGILTNGVVPDKDVLEVVCYKTNDEEEIEDKKNTKTITQ